MRINRAGISRVLLPLGLIAALALVLVLSHQNETLASQNAKLRRTLTQPIAGLGLPTFWTVTLAGDSVTIGERADGGRQVLFAFTTTCPYCRASIPAWKRIAAAAHDAPPSAPPAVAYGLVLDTSVAAVTKYVSENALPYAVARFPTRKLASLYRVQSVPATIVLDADGRVIFSHVGVLTDPVVVDSVIGAMRWRRALPAPSPAPAPIAVRR